MEKQTYQTTHTVTTRFALHSRWSWAGALLLLPSLLGAKGCDVADIGSDSTVCGGLDGKACQADEFCDFPASAQCGAADATGTCKALPEACTLIYAPVCGCDGKTYGNTCEANAAGVSVDFEGECEPTADVCGGLLGEECAADEFCSFPPEARCGAADATGTCQAIPDVCTEEYAPVCGCDGKTYGNACDAHAHGVSVAASGECGAEPSDEICGGLLGLACGDDEFCSFPVDAMCGFADATGVCETRPDACDAIYAPVCGCDGKTYSSDCVAHSEGVSVLSDGECEG